MATFLMALHIFVCVVLILVVLVQSGKDGGIGMMSGGGSQTVFGSSGGANFFTKFTSVLAAVFMITSIFLTVTKGGKKGSVFADEPGRTLPVPAAPANTTTAPGATKTAPAATAVTPAAPAAAPAAAPTTDAKKK